MIDENRNLSRNRKRRTEQKAKLSDEMKSLLNKTKTETEEKNEKNDKNRNLGFEMVKIKYANNPNIIQYEL